MIESQQLEFKKSLAEIKEILETVSAFSNTKGGKIYVGIEENKEGSIKEVVGIKVKGKEIEHLANEIKQSTDPVVFPSVELKKMGREGVLVIEVAESSLRPVFAKGSAYKRVGKSNLKLTVEEIRKMARDGADYNFTDLVCKEAKLEDIDWDFVKKVFITLYESVSERKVTSTATELLESLKCIQKNKPTRAGILLFGKAPQKFFVNAYTALAKYKGTVESAERLDFKEFVGNLFQQIDECDKYIKSNVAVMSRLHPYRVRREDIPEYGLFSIRELVTNAVCHRDYADQGSKVIIKIFRDRIDFYNPGGLPKDITPQNILKRQYSRNPIIANVLTKVKYIEELGEGWNKIIKEHKEHPLKPKLPKIHADKSSLLISLFSAKENFEEEKNEKVIELNERQRKAIEYIKEKEKITKEVYCSLNKVSGATAKRDLKNLVDKKVLKQAGKGPSAHYVLE